MTSTHVGIIVVRHIVDLVFLDKGRVKNPRCLGNDFVDPATMPNGLTPTITLLETTRHLKGEQTYRSA